MKSPGLMGPKFCCCLQLLSVDELRTMRAAACNEVPVNLPSNKIFEPVYKLSTGLPAAAAQGLEDRMCVQANRAKFYERIGKEVIGIQEEVDEFSLGSSDPEVIEVKELLHYIRFETTGEKEYKNGIRDHGRGQMTLSDFKLDPKAQTAKLSEAELVAIRLYTTIAYIFMNKPLRDDERHSRGEQCPLAVTTHFAWTGIKKLRALHVQSGERILWRGMRNLEVADGFMRWGGTEQAFMSTTRDLNVAVRYCLSKQSLLFKIVSPGFMTMGADVQWLSAFPGEAEILYPPLTYLQPTGRSQVDFCPPEVLLRIVPSPTPPPPFTLIFIIIIIIIIIIKMQFNALPIMFLKVHLSQEVQVERAGQIFTFTVVEVHPQLS